MRLLASIGLSILMLASAAEAQKVDNTGRRCIQNVKGTVLSLQNNYYQYGASITNGCNTTIYVRICRTGGSCSTVMASSNGTTSTVIGGGNSSSFDFDWGEVD